MKKADIGLIGLAVMGENLVMNMMSKGFTVAVYNRTIDKVDAFVNARAKGKPVIGTHSIAELVDSLEKPRKVMLMVKAGAPVDAFIDQLLPHLEAADIIIDGGNSHFMDTIRRTEYVESKGLYYIGAGVSGGEEGALNGPSIMPGGSENAWESVKPIFQSIAAKVEDGSPCCDWVGSDGAGHFVKMVHNGIEYGDMQIISESYHLMKTFLGLSADAMYEVYDEWNQGDLNSYLVEITRDIMTFQGSDGQPVLDKILDKAGQKGTGKWTSEAAMDHGIPLTLISEAVFARAISAQKDERVAAAQHLEAPKASFDGDRGVFLNRLKQSVYAAKIISYAQGYALLKAAAENYGWCLDYGGIALMWRGGCIIRSAFLGKIKEAYNANPGLTNLLLDPYFMEKVQAAIPDLREVVSQAVLSGIPVPTLSAAVTYFDSYRSAWLPANLIQAQRDYFGAHTYERTDKPRGEFFHTNWMGQGGDTTSNTYNA